MIVGRYLHIVMNGGEVIVIKNGKEVGRLILWNERKELRMMFRRVMSLSVHNQWRKNILYLCTNR